MQVSRDEGYKSLAEAVIRVALTDLRCKSDGDVYRSYRLSSARFFLNEDKKDLWTGLAPHMIRDWEQAEKEAEEVYQAERERILALEAKRNEKSRLAKKAKQKAKEKANEYL